MVQHEERGDSVCICISDLLEGQSGASKTWVNVETV